MLLKRIYILLFFSILCNAALLATHIVGGEIFYDYLGNDDYRVTIKVYRDCFNGVAPFDNPLSLGIYDSHGTLVRNELVSLPGYTKLPPTLNNPCFQPPTNVCVEEAIYTVVVKLPPIAGGYYLAYQRCCRNKTISNLISPGLVGSTYFTQVLDPAIVTINNSPRFKNFPPLFLCAGVPLVFDHSATDADGDSLAYELCDPYLGADSASPMPSPPMPPPYTNVPFKAPYSGTYPMSAKPPISINPKTGLLTGTPNMIGQWVVGVCVKEYRNGKLINLHRRDFQFNVVSCPGIITAAIPQQLKACQGMTIHFDNASSNATLGYLWDFGDPKTLSDTSRLEKPTYTYSDTGTYLVRLIINPGTSCADTAFSTFKIYPPLNPVIRIPPPQCITGNNFSFISTGGFTNKANILWTFSPQANTMYSTQQNPANIIYSAGGKFPVKFKVSDYGCTDSIIDTVIVYPLPVAQFNATPVSGCVPYTVQFSDSSIHGTPLTYSWDFGDGTSSALANPLHTYKLVGTYDVSLTITASNGCIATLTFKQPNMVTVHPIPTAGFSVNPTNTSIFEPEITITDLSLNSVKTIVYLGNGDTSSLANFVYSYKLPGHYTLTQIVKNSLGCTDTVSLEVIIRPEFRFFIPEAYTPNGDGLNEVFRPVMIGVKDFHFDIFDRWGQHIYTSSDLDGGWNGEYHDHPCQQDVYVWKVTFRDVVDNKEHTYIGHVTLVR